MHSENITEISPIFEEKIAELSPLRKIKHKVMTAIGKSALLELDGSISYAYTRVIDTAGGIAPPLPERTEQSRRNAPAAAKYLRAHYNLHEEQSL